MKSVKSLFLLAILIAVLPSAAAAAAIDMKNPRRALGREDDIRVDAQLLQETISPGSPIAVTYQIQNLTSAPIAIADKVAEASYDAESRTITLSLGSEVPLDGNVPKLVTIEPGEKKVFRAAAVAAINAAELRARRDSGPRYVRMKVSVLRNLEPFKALLGLQSRGPQPLPDELLDRWFESNDTIFLNAVPVRFSPAATRGFSAAERGGRGGF
jgi:hypothetical protein